MVQNQNFEKLLKTCLDIDLKIKFLKHFLGQKCCTLSEKFDKISKNENVKKNNFALTLS